MNLGTSLGELKSKCAARIRSCDHEALLDFAGRVAHDDLLPIHLTRSLNRQSLERLAVRHLRGHTLGLGLPNTRQGPYLLRRVR
jgi:hypothetical protein